MENKSTDLMGRSIVGGVVHLLSVKSKTEGNLDTRAESLSVTWIMLLRTYYKCNT
jgi:hypothetical protein